MATNIAQQSVPSYWTSSNDNIVYKFSFTAYAIDSITNDGGYAKVNLVYDFDVTPIVGEYIYIKSSIYNGQYKILTVTGTSAVTIDTDYNGTITSNTYNCYHLRLPTFAVWRGIPGYTSTPSILTTISPSITYSNEIPYININVKGIVKRMFTINPYNTPDGYDTDIFDAVWLEWDGLETQGDYPFDNYTLVLNCAMTNDELNEKFTTGGFYLCPTDRPIIYDSGVTFLSYISSVSLPVLHKYINGIKQ